MQINQLLSRNLEVGYASSLGVTGSASDIIKQNMMINAMKDWGNISDKYGYTRADDLQKSNWKISGELAKEYLPLLLNIMKGLIYASFIFVVPLMILSGGVTHYLKYCAVVFSLQIWPALNAVLNLFIELYSKVRVSALTSGDLTFANFSQVHEAVDTIVLVASGLQMSIPFLSFAIVQGGVGSFVHLASTIQGGSSSAATTASNEETTGNRSTDNISRDTASIGNKSGFKTDFNQLHQEGAKQIQGADGSILKSFADGTSSISSGSGVNKSSGARALVMEDGMHASRQEGFSKSLSSLRGDEQHYRQEQSSATSTATDLVSHLAQKQVAGESINLDQTTEEGKAMQQMVNNTVSLRDRDGYGWSQAAKSSVSGYIEGGAKIPDVVPFVKGSVGARIEGAVSADNSSNQSLDKETAATRSNDTSHNLNTVLRAGSNEHYLKDDEMSKSLAQSTKASYDKMQGYGQSISQRREEVENYSDAIQASQSKGGSDRRDMTHEVELKVAGQYGVSQEDAHQMIQSNDPRANKVWDSMVQAQTNRELAQVRAGKNIVENNASRAGVAFHNEHSGKINNQGQQDLQKQASEDGLDTNIMKARINQTHSKVGDKQEDMTKNAKQQIHSVEHKNIAMEQGMDNKVKEYEEDRFSKNLGIGGMNAQEKASEYLKGAEKAIQIPSVKPLKSKGGKKSE